MTTRRDFNPRLRDAEDQPIVARSRGSTERADFRAKAPPVDPTAVTTETLERIAASAARSPRERVSGGSSASQGLMLDAMERRLRAVEQELVVTRARLAELEGQGKATAA